MKLPKKPGEELTIAPPQSPESPAKTDTATSAKPILRIHLCTRQTIDAAQRPEHLEDAPLDWRARFDRDDHLFKPGEQVRVPARIKNINGAIVLVADDQDGRMADNFFLPAETPQETLDILKQYEGIAVTYVVTILSVIDRDYQVSDIHEYNVMLEPDITLPPVNPTEEIVSALPKGTRITIEGRLIKIELRDEDDIGRKTKRTYFIIETDDGLQLTIAHSAEPKYGDGVKENLDEKHPQIGEKIRCTAYIREEHGRKLIHAQYSNLYLLEASAERSSEYQELRETVEREINQLRNLLGSEQYPEARRLFANTRKRELTKNESATILADDVLGSFPQQEKPIIYEDRYRIDALDAAFDVMVESMTAEEFLQFARDVSIGKRIPTGEECDESYVYDIMEVNGYSDETRLEVFSEAMDKRLRRLEETPARSFHAEHNHSWVLKMSLRHLASVNSPEAVRKILEIARYCIQNGYYMQQQDVGAGWTPRSKFSNLLDEAIDALVHSTEQYPNNIAAVRDHYEEILSWQRTLEQCALLAFEQKLIDGLTQVTAPIAALPPHAEQAQPALSPANDILF